MPSVEEDGEAAPSFFHHPSSPSPENNSHYGLMLRCPWVKQGWFTIASSIFFSKKTPWKIYQKTYQSYTVCALLQNQAFKNYLNQNVVFRCFNSAGCSKDVHSAATYPTLQKQHKV